MWPLKNPKWLGKAVEGFVGRGIGVVGSDLGLTVRQTIEMDVVSLSDSDGIVLEGQGLGLGLDGADVFLRQVVADDAVGAADI